MIRSPALRQDSIIGRNCSKAAIKAAVLQLPRRTSIRRKVESLPSAIAQKKVAEPFRNLAAICLKYLGAMGQSLVE